MTEVYVALGSNIEPERNIAAAIRELENRFGSLRLSPLYRNPAVGFDGDDFLNMVAGFSSELRVHAIAEQLDIIERAAGRDRNAGRYSSRTLDLDLLFYGDDIIDDPDLTLPRPEILEYAFVLKPLVDIAGQKRHPVAGKTLAELWAAFDQQSHPMTPVPWPDKELVEGQP